MTYTIISLILTLAAAPVFAGGLESMTASQVAASPSEVALPAEPAADLKVNTLPQALRKIKLNTADEGMNDTLVGLLRDGMDIDWVLGDLASMGFRAKAYAGAAGGYFVMVDVKGLDESDYAIGLARVYYVTEVRVGRAIYEEIFGGGAKSTYAVRQGTINGTVNGGRAVDLRINKIDWTVTGTLDGSPVGLQVDHEGKLITGTVHSAFAHIRFVSNAKRLELIGTAFNAPLKYLADWKKGSLSGYMRNAPVRLDFDMKEDCAGENLVEITGVSGDAPVSLRYDKISGQLAGSMNGGTVDLKLVNCDLYDFLQYFFLFAGKN